MDLHCILDSVQTGLFLFFSLTNTVVEALTFTSCTDTTEFGKTLNEPKNKVGNGGDMAK